MYLRYKREQIPITGQIHFVDKFQASPQDTQPEDFSGEASKWSMTSLAPHNKYPTYV